MKKTWFDKALFKDAFRQLFVAGMIVLLVMCIQAVLLPLGSVIADANTQHGREIVKIYTINPMMFLLFSMATPLFAIGLFRFLSRRNECDFYHSIPQTRQCLFVSFSAAVLAWTVILQVVPTVLSLLVHMVFKSHFIIEWSSVLPAFGILFITECYVLAAVLLAVTVTGSILTNLAASLLIIFFPRICMLAVKIGIGSTLTIVSENYLSFLGNGWNTATSLVLGVFTGGIDVLGSGKAGAYTLLLAVIYYLLALGMFVKRRSEAAGEASINPVLQLVFRLAPATAYCLVPTMLVFTYLTGRDQNITAWEWYMLFIMYLIGIFIYFMYELITTRKIKKMLKAAPGLILLAGIQLIVLFGMIGLRSSLLAYSPAGSEIESVQFSGEMTYSPSYDGLSVNRGYLTSRVADVKITEEHVKEIVATRLKETVEYDRGADQTVSEEDEFLNKQVVITSGGRKHYRTIHMRRSDVAEIAKVMKDNSEFRNVYMDLPAENDPRLTLNLSGFLAGGSFSDEETRTIYSRLKEDAADMGFEKWYELCLTESMYGGNSFILYMQYDEGTGTTGSVFPVDARTPKAFAMCMEMAFAKQQESLQKTVSVLEDMDRAYTDGEGPNLNYMNVFFTTYSEKGDYLNDYSVDLSDEAQRKALIGLLKKQGNEVPAGAGFATLSVNFEYVNADDGFTPPAESYVDPESSYYAYDAYLILDRNGLDGMDLSMFTAPEG